MLILMRRAGESIYIGPNIVITLVSLEGNRARIGIQAPREITVDRQEVGDRKREGLPPLPPVRADAITRAVYAEAAAQAAPYQRTKGSAFTPPKRRPHNKPRRKK